MRNGQPEHVFGYPFPGWPTPAYRFNIRLYDDVGQPLYQATIGLGQEGPVFTHQAKILLPTVPDTAHIMLRTAHLVADCQAVPTAPVIR